MATKTYNSNEVTIVLGGIPVDSGFADGEFLKITSTSDAFLDVVGTDGEITRSKSNDESADIEIILMQSSSSNARLSTLHNLDKASPGGAGIVPILIKDRNGTSLYAGKEAWIKKAPDKSFDKTATARSWPIRVGKLVCFDGGN